MPPAMSGPSRERGDRRPRPRRGPDGAGAADRRRLLSIYLNDHAALGVVAVEIARRAAAGHAGTPFGDHARALARWLDGHAAALERLMTALGVRRNPLKLRGAWLMEKAGRLKLNGRIRSTSPLSAVVEAESLLATVGAFAVLWRGLDHLRDPSIARSVHTAGLAAEADEQLGELERRRLELLGAAIGGRRELRGRVDRWLGC